MMVAYTHPDCLPYFEGTDSPCLNTGTVCDPSSVWCDFAEAVEATLNTFDEVASVATSPPIAWVETTTPFNVVIGSGTDETPPFDTVRVDTANMVNLDVSNSGFTITRSGLYMVFGYLFGTLDLIGGTSAALDMTIEFTPNLSLYGAGSIITLDGDGIAPLDGAQVTVAIHSVVPLAAGQTLVAQINRSGVSGDIFTITQATLGAAWMGELP